MERLDRKGFTLVELIATIVILALVMGIGSYAITGLIQSTRENEYELLVKNINDAVELYNQECSYGSVDESNAMCGKLGDGNLDGSINMDDVSICNEYFSNGNYNISCDLDMDEEIKSEEIDAIRNYINGSSTTYNIGKVIPKYKINLGDLVEYGFLKGNSVKDNGTASLVNPIKSNADISSCDIEYTYSDGNINIVSVDSDANCPATCDYNPGSIGCGGE